MKTFLINLAIPLCFLTPAFAQSIVIDSQAEWVAAKGSSQNLTLKAGMAEPVPAADQAQFDSSTQSTDGMRQLSSVVFKQSPIWDNWEQIDDITPVGLGNAYVFLPVAPGDYYLFATYKGPQPKYPKGLSKRERQKYKKEWLKTQPDHKSSVKGYHGWHSTNLKEWKHLGPICKSNWVTTAEYADGKFFIYYDEPNDQDPHLMIDSDLTDGKPGEYLGKVFEDPSHGSDCGVFRDEDGTFHMIYEDWSPINARENAWDSPLAGRVTSRDGMTGFKFGEHPWAIDKRTQPTGKTGTFQHSSMSVSNQGKPLEYEIHEPAQEAYGDYTLIKVGEDYHLFCDYDSADHSKKMRMGRFTTNDLTREFQWSGEIGEGFHPDPSVGFAEGQFYAIMQQKTDFVSPGPWVDGIEARAGVDTDADGEIDQWTNWQSIKEGYSQKPGFARIVDVAPASLDTTGLPKASGFQFQFKTSRLANGVQPIMDRVTLNFAEE